VGNSSHVETLVWQQEIYEENASYIAVHFKEVRLSKDDYLVIRDPDNTRCCLALRKTVQILKKFQVHYPKYL
jgi:hypothetical protein